MSPVVDRRPLSARTEELVVARGAGEGVLTWRQVAQGWRDDVAFRKTFAAAVRAAPYEAFYWETAPLSPTTADAAFACIVSDAPALARTASDPAPFGRQLRGDGPVVRFENLGGDATLIAPRPIAPEARYAHLATFLRTAPAMQVDALWAELGRAVTERLARDADPFWVSTSGLGVPWLHLRIDRRPKYYTHVPYRRAPE